MIEVCLLVLASTDTARRPTTARIVNVRVLAHELWHVLIQPFVAIPTTTTTATTTFANIGWTLAAKSTSCTAACANHNSACHVASHQSIDTKAELEFILTQAGQGGLISGLLNNHMCFFYEQYAPAVTIPSVKVSVFHNGAYSTCDAVPVGDIQRLCCCSPSGCTTSA
jgi:hypothetical protein